MDPWTATALALVLGLLAYLTAALLAPELFE